MQLSSSNLLKSIKSLLYILLFCAPSSIWAQFTGAKVSLNGLTCSQCSRSVEMALRRIDFVQSIKMDLQKPTAILVFKKSGKVEFEKIAKAVKAAGFSIGTIVADYTRSLQLSNSYCFLDNNVLYNSVNMMLVDSPEKIKILLLGKGLISEIELKKIEITNTAKPCDLKSKKSIPFMLIP